MAKQHVLFDERFLDTWVGPNILHSPRTAVIELIANAWDAGATRVDIVWPDGSRDAMFSIKDNGEGMTQEQFSHRWRTLAYDRLREQGQTVEIAARKKNPPRTVYGQNGVGRFAGFCFADKCFVETWREGTCTTHSVTRGQKQPIVIEKVKEVKRRSSGTRVYVEEPSAIGVTADDVRADIGMRFLTDPNFKVYLDGRQVSLLHIPDEHIRRFDLDIDDVGTIEVIAIDTLLADRTTVRHGVAWHVNGRLVGECSWKGTGDQDLIDGRRSAAKRYTLIVTADCLAAAVKADWSGFNEDCQQYQQVADAVYEKVQEFFLEVSKSDRNRTFKQAKKANVGALSRMSMRGADKWKRFVQETQVKCPTLQQKDLIQLSTVLANLEVAESRYGLLHKLGDLESGQLDDLHQILEDWTLDMAKTVLDEIRTRLELLDELKRKVSDERTDEVQELQPLFKQGLWIFGPEFETIEFTSNEGMTKVINDLFKPTTRVKGSRNRPDFAILPDGTAGLYTHPKYDPETHAEVGVARLVVVELKKPGVTVSTDEKAQCWKYIKELYSRGLLLNDSRVICFALGSKVDPLEAEVREEKSGTVRIQPLDYGTIIERAKSRMHKLYDRVKDAPFLDKKEKEELDDFLTSANVKDEAKQAKMFKATA